MVEVFTKLEVIKKHSEGYIIMDYNLFFKTELELRSPIMKNGLTSVEASPFYFIYIIYNPTNGMKPLNGLVFQ